MAKLQAKLTIKLHTNCIKYLVGQAEAQTNNSGRVNIPEPINKQQIFYANFQFNTALNAHTQARTHTCRVLGGDQCKFPWQEKQQHLTGRPSVPPSVCLCKIPINRMWFPGTLRRFVVIFIIYTDRRWTEHTFNGIWLPGFPDTGETDRWKRRNNIELEIIEHNLFVFRFKGTWKAWNNKLLIRYFWSNIIIWQIGPGGAKVYGRILVIHHKGFSFSFSLQCDAGQLWFIKVQRCLIAFELETFWSS